MRQAATQALRRIGSLSLLVPAMAGAVVALTYYGYSYAGNLASRSEQSIMATNREIAESTVRRIEQLMIDSDRTLFELVDIRSLQDFPRRWSDIMRLSPVIESAMVLDEKQRIVPDGHVSRQRQKTEVEAFRALFEASIVPDLELSKLADGEHKHLHGEYQGRYHLLSFVRLSTEGRQFFVVLQVDLAFLVGEVFPEAFSGIDERRVYQVVDERNRLVFGHPFARIPSKYTVAVPFSQTLYKWRLRMAPREAPSLVAGESQRRMFHVVLIVLSAATVLVGLGVLTLAVRTERRASQLKSDFVANVSHELKTPLSLIRMFGEILASGQTKGPEVAKEYADIITRESERLTHLIDNLLDLARIERGQEAFSLKPTDLSEVVHRAADILRWRIERAGMTMTVTAAGNLPLVRLDEDAITLVLLNLLDNAVKYAAEGKTIAVSLSAIANRVVLQVNDRGPGIAKEEQNRVFDRFYRPKAVRGRPIRGSGIGLSLVRQIARAHGGDAGVQSNEGHGSTFSVWFPATRESTPEHERTSISTQES
ncbi:MAG: HAMP domain-containing sensor histidine kinase [Pseudomonadota bacterium]